MAITTMAIIIIHMLTINFARRIFTRLYGLTSNSLMVPLLNSSLTIEPAITIPIIKINNSYWLKKLIKISRLSVSNEILFSM